MREKIPIILIFLLIFWGGYSVVWYPCVNNPFDAGVTALE